MTKKSRPLGSILLENRLITTEVLEEALLQQKKNQKSLGQTLIDLNHITQEQLETALHKKRALEEEDAKKPPSFPGTRSRGWLRQKRIPISRKISLLIIIIILGIVLPVSFLILKKQNEQAVQRTMAFGTALMNTYANYSAEFVLLEDWPSLDPLIREVGKLEEVSYVFIINKDNVIKAHNNYDMIDKTYQWPNISHVISEEPGLIIKRYADAETMHILDFAAAITYGGKKIGNLHLGISEARMERDARNLTYFIIILTAMAIIAGLLISYSAGSIMSKPIDAIVEGTREVVRGNFDHRISPAMNDELGDLALAFNDMADGLKKKELIQDSFGRYVTPEIVELILKNPEEVWLKGSRKMVTILFADIRDFTSFSEDREPEEVVAALNQFFTIATNVILSEGGNVDKFVGDQVMAVFGAPIYHDDHAVKAARTAVKLTAELDRWNCTRQQENKSIITAGIGINSGLVVAGNLGSNQRMEYTVIGDDVNLASRLTALSGPGEIIVSEKTRQFIKDSFNLIALDPINIKGKKHPLTIYKIEGMKDGMETSEV